jgi:hypothetical protein
MPRCKEFPPILGDECQELLNWFWRCRVADSPSVADCWQWIGSFNGKGYGITSIPGYKSWKFYLAHRVMYRLAYPGVDIDCLHLDHDQYGCERICVNPYHLEPMTPREHSRQTRLMEGSRNGSSAFFPFDFLMLA